MDEFAVMQAKVETLETTVAKLNETMDSLSKEVLSLKESSYYHDQHDKSSSVWISGLGVTKEEANDTSGRALSKRDYDLIVRPVLAAAKANKQIDVLPNLANTFSVVYRIKTGSVSNHIVEQPAPVPAHQAVIVKFASPSLRLAFLCNKKASLPTPVEADLATGFKRYSVAEDLTGTTYKKLREMVTSDLVDKVRLVDEKLYYTLPGDGTVRQVKSVY